MPKSFRVRVNLNGLRKTLTGKPKIWRSDLVRTYCCSAQACYFIWEKNTKHNGYNGYYGYVQCSNVITV